jgi:hypothetical protein
MLCQLYVTPSFKTCKNVKKKIILRFKYYFSHLLLLSSDGMKVNSIEQMNHRGSRHRFLTKLMIILNPECT